MLTLISESTAKEDTQLNCVVTNGKCKYEEQKGYKHGSLGDNFDNGGVDFAQLSITLLDVLFENYRSSVLFSQLFPL